LERYGWPARTPAAQVLGQLHGSLRRIPSALAYGGVQSQEMREPVAA
jgi:hypothetical protein